MKKKQKDDVTTSFNLPVETLAQVKKISRRVGMNPGTFCRCAIVAMLERFEEGVDR